MIDPKIKQRWRYTILTPAGLICCSLSLAVICGCSSLSRTISGRSWSESAAQENYEQHRNASPDSNPNFAPFGAP